MRAFSMTISGTYVLVLLMGCIAIITSGCTSSPIAPLRDWDEIVLQRAITTSMARTRCPTAVSLRIYPRAVILDILVPVASCDPSEVENRIVDVCNSLFIDENHECSALTPQRFGLASVDALFMQPRGAFLANAKVSKYYSWKVLSGSDGECIAVTEVVVESVPRYVDSPDTAIFKLDSRYLTDCLCSGNDSVTIPLMKRKNVEE
jgi:hypothetical protein